MAATVELGGAELTTATTTAAAVAILRSFSTKCSCRQGGVNQV